MRFLHHCLLFGLLLASAGFCLQLSAQSTVTVRGAANASRPAKATFEFKRPDLLLLDVYARYLNGEMINLQMQRSGHWFLKPGSYPVILLATGAWGPNPDTTAFTAFVQYEHGSPAGPCGRSWSSREGTVEVSSADTIVARGRFSFLAARQCMHDEATAESVWVNGTFEATYNSFPVRAREHVFKRPEPHP